MPTYEEFKNNRKTTTVNLTGISGSGKSTLAAQAPQPIAFLLCDKDTPTCPPNVDPSGIFFKAYPPAIVDISTNTYLRARNIMDEIIADITGLRQQISTSAKTIKIKVGTDDKGQPVFEEWPMPATIVFEGGTALSDHAVNRILTMNSCTSEEEFALKMSKTSDGKPNPFILWKKRLEDILQLYNQFLRLPGCNKVITTWPSQDNDPANPLKKIDIWRPDFGGKLDVMTPGLLESSLYCYSESGQFFVRTRNSSRFQGFKVGNRYDLAENINVSLKKDEKRNFWNEILG